MPKFANVSQLLTLPGDYTKPEPNASYSVGDTHGNAVVLVRYLFDAGLINITQDQYDKIIATYTIDSVKESSSLTRQDCEQFREIIREGFKAASVPEDIQVRCFGDMLADRGSNDILSLIVLDELRKNFPHLKGTILISNHDKTFLRNYLTGKLRPGETLTSEVSPAISLTRLKNLIDKNSVSYDEVDAMLQSAYLPALKFVDYVRTENGGIDIMAHAPITLDNIDKAMTTLLHPSEHLDITASADNAALILDKLNAVFSQGMTDPTSLIYQAITSHPNESNPLYPFIWTRLNEVQPATKKATYPLRFRHGHDGSPGEKIIHGISYVGYNNEFGKTTPQQWQHATNTTALLSQSVTGNVRADIEQASDEVMAMQIPPTTIIDNSSIEQMPKDTGFIVQKGMPEKFYAPSPSPDPGYIVQKGEKNTVFAQPSSSGATTDLTKSSFFSFSPKKAVIQEQDLHTFKTLATYQINEYISKRGSFTQTSTGDTFWSSVAQVRNKLRSTVNMQTVDVPQVDKAKKLKTAINSMTADSFEESWTQFKKELLNPEDVRLGQSGEYITLLKDIINANPLEETNSSLNSNSFH